jgi:hypothetical protein
MKPFYKITITDRIQWKERCEWIEQHCPGWQDHTDWSMWSLGYSDIEYLVKSGKHATIYYLVWP